MIKLAYGHLCDYATQTQNGKLVLVGVFDRIFAKNPQKIQIPSCYLVFDLQCSVGDGPDHLVELELLNEDEVSVTPRTTLDGFLFKPNGPGLPMRGRGIMQLVGLGVPRYGDYHFRIYVDGAAVGELPLFVSPTPEQ